MSPYFRPSWSPPRATGVVIVAVLALVFAGWSVALSSSVANAAAGDDITAGLEFSNDSGTTWGGRADVLWSADRPAPGVGGEAVTEFLVRNSSTFAGQLEIYVGRWNIEQPGSGTFRAYVDDVAGTPKELRWDSTYQAGIEMAASPLAAQSTAKVMLKTGIPSAETAQLYKIDPDWSIALTKTGDDDDGNGNGGQPGGNGGNGGDGGDSSPGGNGGSGSNGGAGDDGGQSGGGDSGVSSQSQDGSAGSESGDSGGSRPSAIDGGSALLSAGPVASVGAAMLLVLGSGFAILYALRRRHRES